MRTALLVASTFSAALLFGTAPTASAGTLDQQQPDGSGGWAYAQYNQSLAQTFTAGITGGLDRIDLDLRKVTNPSSALTVELRDVAGGTPGSQILTGRLIPASAIPTSPSHGFVQIDLPSPVAVVAGTQYAIVLFSAAGASSYAIDQPSVANPYPGGALFYDLESPPTSWTPWNPSDDGAFKTYVVPAPAAAGPTGQRAAALASCKKRAEMHNWSKKRLKKCKRKANLLPV